jgi:hypothetical protein
MMDNSLRINKPFDDVLGKHTVLGLAEAIVRLTEK